jgi:uncharacterized delta-60 repeat protein
MTKNYRFRTKVGQDREVRLQIEQDFDMIEILSLKLKQEDVYTRFCADYGVIAGRVIANGGYGVPNVSISVFVPLSAQDENDPIISTLYPYKRVDQKNEDGYRYNLLPYKQEYGGHTPTGTFPDIQDILERKEVLEIYEKYYKYTVRTNDSGDFMIVGVPLGMQTIVMDMDLSNIGCFSLRPSDLIRMGMGVESQFNGSQFKSSTDIESLPQIINSKKDIEVTSFWGEDEICNVGITRVDFDLRELGIKIEPQAVFMGSMISTTEDGSLGANCKPKLDSGNLCDLISAPGKILAIRQTIYTDVLGYPILEQYKLPEGGNVIDDEGTWLVEVPMNLDFVTTNEFGEQVFSSDPNNGIPTKAKYRFKIQYQNEDGNNASILRADYLVPNIKEYGWNLSQASENGPIYPDLQKKSYAFSLDWQDYGDTGTTLGNQIIQEAINCEDKFFEFNFNRVYTISNFIDRWKWGYNRARHMGIKEITDRTCNSTTNKMPVNDGVRNFDFIFFLFNLLITILSPIFLVIVIIYHFVAKVYPIIRRVVNVIIRTINNIIGAICDFLNWLRDKFGRDPKDCNPETINELPEKLFPRLSLPMMAYPDCEACNCETVQAGTDPSDDYPNNDFTNERVNQSQLIDVNSVGEWNWEENYVYNSFQSYCTQFPEGCDITEDTLNYGVNQAYAGYSGPNTGGKYKLQKTPIATWVSQDSRVGSQAYTIHWAQVLNSMNSRTRYFENQSVITTTIKNKDFQNVEQPSPPINDQPLILICDPGTIASIGGAGSLVTFTNALSLSDPNLTGATPNQFNSNSVTGTSNYNLTQLVNKQINSVNPTYYSQSNSLTTVKLKLTKQYQDYKFRGGVEYFQVITGGTLDFFNQYVPQPIWDSFIGQYVYGAGIKFRWGKGYGSNSVYGKTPNGEVRAIALNSLQDELYLGGTFTQYGTQYNRRLVKVDTANGNYIPYTQPPGFSNNGFNGNVNAVETTTTGELIVGGEFTDYIGTPQIGIAKLATTGFMDTTFETNSSGGFGDFSTPEVTDIKIQANGKIIACGRFDEYAGVPLSSDNVIRLNADGTVDGSFTPPAGSIEYFKVALDENPSSPHYQKIYLATNNVLGNKKVIRLNTNGTLDATFNTTFNTGSSYVRSLKVDNNGKLLIGLDTVGFISSGTQYYGILRLNTNGTVDTTFNGGNVGMVSGNSVLAIDTDANNNILVGGVFNTYNGQPRVSVLRLLSNGTLDGTFSYGTTALNLHITGYEGTLTTLSTHDTSWSFTAVKT